ncbi:Leucine rich repeat protein [Spraguea lophii 42_110]|uniref:Leucine rich repeat protein n=1 Tax=Spraguea lophii (strain 42_110) TaxID=1358809 RepID=S7W8A2_SPRLO|nr:Leucine rich repeat protein [Spraguea lophii 42_110]
MLLFLSLIYFINAINFKQLRRFVGRNNDKGKANLESLRFFIERANNFEGSDSKCSLTINFDNENILFLDGKEQIIMLPNDIYKLSKLDKIYYIHSDVDELPERFGELINLNYLELSFDSFSTIPEEVFSLQNLEQLNLENNKIINISDKINKLKKLKYLNLSNNPITIISDELFNLKFLKILNIENIGYFKNFFNISKSAYEFTMKLSMLENLEELYISNNNLKSISHELFLPKLKMFFCENNLLKKLPDNFNINSQLKELHLKNNRIKKYPKCLNLLDNLQTLDLSSNEISNNIKFNDEVVALKSLVYLNLKYNKIDGFEIYSSQCFNNLENLLISCECFYISQNIKIDSLTYLDLYVTKKLEINSNNFKNIRDLVLSLPYSINIVTMFKNIELESIKLELPISNNIGIYGRFDNHISPSLSFLDNISDKNTLKNLSINRFYLKEFINEIFDYKYLTSLNLADNKIKEIPNRFKNLKELTILDLRHNKLTTVNSIILYMFFLKELYISGNNLLFLPPEFKTFKVTSLIIDDIKLSNTAPKDFVGMLDLPNSYLQNINVEKIKKLDMKSVIEIYKIVEENVYKIEDDIFNADCYLWNVDKLISYKPNEIIFYDRSYDYIITLWNKIFYVNIQNNNIRDQMELYLKAYYQNIKEGNIYTKHLPSKIEGKNAIKKYIENIFEIFEKQILNEINKTITKKDEKLLRDDFIQYILKQSTFQEKIKKETKTLILVTFTYAFGGIKECVDGQLEAWRAAYTYLKNNCLDNINLPKISNKRDGLNIASNLNEVFLFFITSLATIKENSLRKVTAYDNNDQNIHVFSYWKDILKKELGFEKVYRHYNNIPNFPLQKCRGFIIYRWWKEMRIKNVIKHIHSMFLTKRKDDILTKIKCNIINIICKINEEDLEKVKDCFIYDGDITYLQISDITENAILLILNELEIIYFRK